MNFIFFICFWFVSSNVLYFHQHFNCGRASVSVWIAICLHFTQNDDKRWKRTKRMKFNHLSFSLVNRHSQFNRFAFHSTLAIQYILRLLLPTIKLFETTFWCCCCYCCLSFLIRSGLLLISHKNFWISYSCLFFSFAVVVFFFSSSSSTFNSSSKRHFSLAPIHILQFTSVYVFFLLYSLLRVSSYCFRTIKFLSMSTTVGRSVCCRSISVILKDFALVKWISLCVRACVCVPVHRVLRAQVYKNGEKKTQYFSKVLPYTREHTHTIKRAAAAAAAQRARRWIIVSVS